MKTNKYDLMEMARLGVLFLPGDLLEDIMPPERKEYPLLVADSDSEFALTDEIDFVEDNYNALKRILLLTERIDPSRSPYASLWIRRPENPALCEVMVAGSALPSEGVHIQKLWEEIERAFGGQPTRLNRERGQTLYYPVRNSDEEIVGVLELTEDVPPMFI
ncbi:hypothetical protein [Cohnella rhizosphaerae]|uniref:Uncharacterized protein n=1 Tax=Cohnella rhizosphaerae TaxID=1457232 RepID=A0A9X4KTT3_9BACL|nr:hypothetical protein [Cohnella rhizosphaerae]MDG0810121.1 hypothetical protein [Cohnella rhizosphaerae]